MPKLHPHSILFLEDKIAELENKLDVSGYNWRYYPTEQQVEWLAEQKRAIDKLEAHYAYDDEWQEYMHNQGELSSCLDY